jgi:hypothetical protein
MDISIVGWGVKAIWSASLRGPEQEFVRRTFVEELFWGVPDDLATANHSEWYPLVNKHSY